MLKLIYIESGFYMERLTQALEQFIVLRVMLAMGVGQKILVEPSSAAFLLPVSSPELSMLEVAAQKEGWEDIAICVADDEFLEVSLGGIWITTLYPEKDNGVFITALSDRIELLLFKLWQATETNASVT